jgi:hypothetical protein
VAENILSISVLGGAVAALVAGKLLLTRYPGTWPLVLRKSFAFWRYVTYYGILGTSVTWVIFQTPLGRIPTISFIPSWIFWPIAVGLLGTLAKTTLVGSMPGADHFHFTIRAVLILFEPALLDMIRNDEFFAVKKFVRPYEERWQDFDAVIDVISRNVPGSDEELKYLRLMHRDLPNAKTTSDAMGLYLRFVGARGFKQIFEQPVDAMKTESYDLLNIKAEGTRPAVVARKPAKAVSREPLADVMPRKAPLESQQVR